MRVSFHFFCVVSRRVIYYFFPRLSFFFSFLFSYYYFCVGPNPLLFIFERMQIGFTKKGLPAGQPRIKLHHPAMQCVSNREPHQHEQTPIIHLPPTSQSKSEIGKQKGRREIVNEKKEKWSIRSILTRTTRCTYKSACSFPQFPSWSKGTLRRAHTQILGKNKKKLNSTLIHLLILLLRNDGRVEYNITTQSANRHNFVLNSIENELHATFQGGPSQGSQMFVQTTADSQGLRRDLLQVVRIIC